MENGKQNLTLNFPYDHSEVRWKKETSSKFIGVSYYKFNQKWGVSRRSKKENKMIFNGCYDDEKTAAHASDTLARKLMENGKQNLKLNFPDDHIELYSKEKKSSKFIGVTSNKIKSKWYVQRWSKKEKKIIYSKPYDDEETAAHASDALARELMRNGKQNLTLNFPYYHSEVQWKKETSSKFIGVSYYKFNQKWGVSRRSKKENKMIFNGCYDDEKRAAHASDTLARKLMENGKQNLKLNFFDDHTELYPKEKKSSKFIGVTSNKIK
jgi:predicted transcriptional regulator